MEINKRSWIFKKRDLGGFTQGSLGGWGGVDVKIIEHHPWLVIAGAHDQSQDVVLGQRRVGRQVTVGQQDRGGILIGAVIDGQLHRLADLHPEVHSVRVGALHGAGDAPNIPETIDPKEKQNSVILVGSDQKERKEGEKRMTKGLTGQRSSQGGRGTGGGRWPPRR